MKTNTIELLFGSARAQAECDRLKEINAELLEALQGLCSLAERRPGYLHDYKAAVANARAAIAKATNQK